MAESIPHRGREGAICRREVESPPRRARLGAVADFSQMGVVPTLHDLGHRSAEDFEADLRAWASGRPVALIIPCLNSEVGSPALDAMVSELAGADWLDYVLVGLDEADEDGHRRARRLFGRLSQDYDVIWNDGPAMGRMHKQLAARGLAPAGTGKGRNVWYCLGAVLARGRTEVVALHDADIVGYDRSLLARLAYPVAHPSFGYRYAKGFYARVTDGRFGGRVTRLLMGPLLEALRAVVGDCGYLRYLGSFRYPLAGESAMDAAVAAALRIPDHWGLEIGLLTDVRRRCDLSSICQVDVARAYDHKHQDLSADDPSGGLHKMSIDVTATILDGLAAAGAGLLDRDRDGLVRPGGEHRIGLDWNRLAQVGDEYRIRAKELIRHYANDAELNGYRIDIAAEESAAAVFAGAVDAAGRLHLTRQQRPTRNPSWQQVLAAEPEAAAMLLEALRTDRSMGW